jgi:hypothetical protein
MTTIMGATAQQQNLTDLQRWIAQEQARTNALIAQLQKQITAMEQEKPDKDSVGQNQPQISKDATCR